MTVLTEETPYTQYIGDGVTEFFAFTFTVLEDSNILVYLDDIPSDYEREANGVRITPAPGVGVRVEIYRATEISQLADFTAQEAFHAEKTEDACDKLILLKQEAKFFLASMNLTSQPFLDNVTLVNSVGSDAVIPIWDILTGVYASEVAEDIPAAGTVVQKPKNFVYKQYGPPIMTQILTTTPYPIVEQEAIRMSGDLRSGAMRPIPQDAMDLGFIAGSGELNDILLNAGPYIDEMDLAFAALNGELNDILISPDPYIDEMDLSFTAGDGELNDKLVTGYMPDHAIRMSGNLVPSKCSMTPV